MRLRPIVLLVSIALGCTDTSAPAGQCRFDSDCDEGAVCAGNYCRTGCVTDRDCAAGQRCSESDRFGVLTCHAVAAQSQCNRTSDCPAGLSCLDGACRVQCQQDYDCQVINPFFRCVANACALSCAAGTADCDGLAANGCEARTDSNAHCGRCDNACSTNTVCTAGACASSCAAGTTLCGGSCVETRTSAAHCGRCDNACPSAPNASPSCVASSCEIVCNPGFARSAAGCTAVAAPRLVAPASLSTLNGNRDVVFEVALAPGTDGAVVELCRDRACAMVVERFVGTGARVTRSGALSPGLYFWRAYGRAGTGAGLVPSAQTWEVIVPARAGTGDSASGSVLDVNGDGFADLAVGEPGSGRVLLYPGAATGPGARPATTLTIAAPMSALGTRVAAGDFNGDGFADLAAAAPEVQQVHVFSGSATGLGAAGVSRTRDVIGTFGTALAAGDFNHDGYADLAVGFTCFKGCSPGVDVFLGSATGLAATPLTLTSPDRFSSFGEELAVLGRFSPDARFDSLVVLMRGEGGSSALVYGGTAAGLATTPTQTIVVPGQASHLAAAQDINGDGLPDLAVVAPSVTGAVGLQVFLGSTAGLAATAASIGDGENLGGPVAGLGDVNGDGFGDLIAGNGFHSARVFFGSMSGGLIAGPVLTAPAAPEGTEGYARFSGGLGFVGDLNRDGFNDVVVGAPDDGDTFCTGEVFVFPGGALTAPVAPSIILTVPDARCGGTFGGAIASFARPVARVGV